MISRTGVNKLLQGVFFAYMLFIIPAAAMYTFWRHSLVLPLFILPAAVLGVCVYRRRASLPDLFSKLRSWLARPLEMKLFVLFVAVLMIAQLCVHLWFAFEMRLWPLVDRGFIYDTAVEVAESNGWVVRSELQNAYFLTYGNNIPILVLTAGFFKLVRNFGASDYYAWYTVLNVAVINLSVLIAGFLAQRHYGRRACVLFHMICLLSAPLCMFGAYVYTDAFALFGASGAVLYYDSALQAYDKGDKLRMFVNAVLAALFLCFGAEMKITVLIVAIAAVIHGVLTRRVKFSALVCGLLAMFMLCVNTGIGKIHMIDDTDKEYFAFPYIHWIMLGLSEDQTDGTDANYTASFGGREAKIDADMEMIRIRLSERGALGSVWFLFRKAAYTWGDGEFTMPSYFSDGMLVSQTPWRDWFWDDSDSVQYHVQGLLAGVHYIILLIFMALSLYRGMMRGDFGQSFIWKLSLAGLGLFLLLWESSPRYLFQFYTLIILAALDGFMTTGKPGEHDGVGRNEAFNETVTGIS